jgi:hypothetical protein
MAEDKGQPAEGRRRRSARETDPRRAGCHWRLVRQCSWRPSRSTGGQAASGTRPRRAERTEGTVSFTSLGGQGPGKMTQRETNPLRPAPRRGTNPLRPARRRETNPLRPTSRRAPNEPNVPARNEPKATRPVAPDPRRLAIRNEPNGALGEMGWPCRPSAAIRNEPNGALGVLGKLCRRTDSARNEPKVGGSAPKTNPNRGEGSGVGREWGSRDVARNEAKIGPAPGFSKRTHRPLSFGS